MLHHPKRVIKMAAAVFEVEVPVEKTPGQKMGGSKLHRLPQTSQTGAHRRGPKANPSTDNDSERVANSGIATLRTDV